jgi:DNA-directed RNA polymerase subunit N (RpoN/RPB10)
MKPIRCFTCNKVLGNKWQTIDRLRREGVAYRDIYTAIGLTRYCCQKVVLTCVETEDVNVAATTYPNGPTVSSYIQEPVQHVRQQKIKTQNGFLRAV